MGIFQEPVFRWPVTLADEENQIKCDDGAGGSSATADIPTGTYLVKGTTSGALTDLVDALETALNSCYDSIYAPSSPITVTMTTAGKLTFANSSANDLKMLFTDSDWELDSALCGYPGSADILIPAGDAVTSSYQCSHTWYPDDPVSSDTGEIEIHSVGFSELGPSFTPSYISHSTTTTADVAKRRDLEFERVCAARVWQFWTNDSISASEAGVLQSDPNVPLERLTAWIFSGDSNSPQVYYYDTTAVTATEEGPYYLLLPPDVLEFGGWSRDRLVEEYQRRARISFTLLSPSSS